MVLDSPPLKEKILIFIIIFYFCAFSVVFGCFWWIVPIVPNCPGLSSFYILFPYKMKLYNIEYKCGTIEDKRQIQGQ